MTCVAGHLLHTHDEYWEAITIFRRSHNVLNNRYEQFERYYQLASLTEMPVWLRNELNRWDLFHEILLWDIYELFVPIWPPEEDLKFAHAVF